MVEISKTVHRTPAVAVADADERPAMRLGALRRTPAGAAAGLLGLAVLALTACASPSQLSNGRAIFLTGRDGSGVPISASPRPLFAYCAACHRTDGSGGVHFPGGVVSADLRHRALVTDQRHPYTLALLERAISTGIDNDGEPLDPVMPRWHMPPNDLHDVAAYVLTQLAP